MSESNLGEKKKKNFYAGGFLYNPKTKSVLLHLRDDKAPVNPERWGLFGGTSEEGETPLECFMREMKEELNLDIPQNKIIPLCDYLNTERSTWRYVFYVESELPISAMTLGEGADLRWVPLAEIPRYDLTEKAKNDLMTFVGKIDPQ